MFTLTTHKSLLSFVGVKEMPYLQRQIKPVVYLFIFFHFTMYYLTYNYKNRNSNFILARIFSSPFTSISYFAVNLLISPCSFHCLGVAVDLEVFSEHWHAFYAEFFFLCGLFSRKALTEPWHANCRKSKSMVAGVVGGQMCVGVCMGRADEGWHCWSVTPTLHLAHFPFSLSRAICLRISW